MSHMTVRASGFKVTFDTELDQTGRLMGLKLIESETSTINGWLLALKLLVESVSIGLKSGAPLEEYIRSVFQSQAGSSTRAAVFQNVCRELFRRLGTIYLSTDKQVELGLTPPGQVTHIQKGPPRPLGAPPYCYQCGMVMERAGACFVCGSCGTTSGCD